MLPEIVAIRNFALAGNDFNTLLKELDSEQKEILLPKINIVKSQLSHLRFMQHCWGRARPMEIGLHTWLLCREIDKAFENFRNGISTNLMALICFRAGKSEITTRFLPAHFIAEFPDRNSIVTSHSTKKTAEFSRFGRALIRSEKFKELYPDINISKENAGVEEWGIEGSEAMSQYYGILSGSAGTGGALVVTDDFFGGREDAESQIMRDKTDEAFKNNIFTRRDDPAINLITVTPWHPDDLVGRIKKEMIKEKESTRYKIVCMPYKDPDDETIAIIEEELPKERDKELRLEMEVEFKRYKNGGYLFSKKYSNQWYIDMETSLGGPTGYGTVSLMRCNPQLRGGNRLKTEFVKILKPDEFWKMVSALNFSRGWDLASTIKQIQKSDPDYTSGVKAAAKFIPTSIPNVMQAQLFVADVIRGRWEAPKRNETILETALSDGLIRVGVEAFGAYKDAYNEIKKTLAGVRVIKKMQLPGDKISKASCLEPIFESGNVYLLEAPWNQKYLQELQEFPSGAHDDQVDATVVAFRMFSAVETGYQYNEQMVV